MKYRLFVLVHSSQQREERTKKRRRSYRAFGLVVSVAVGDCGTRSARTVLALFPPSPLRLRCPIKVELISPFSGFIQLSFSIPPSLRATSPIAHTCAEEEVNASLLNSLCFLPLLRFYVQHSRNAAGHGWERGNMLNNNQLMSLCMCKRGQ